MGCAFGWTSQCSADPKNPIGGRVHLHPEHVDAGPLAIQRSAPKQPADIGHQRIRQWAQQPLGQRSINRTCHSHTPPYTRYHDSPVAIGQMAPTEGRGKCAFCWMPLISCLSPSPCPPSTLVAFASPLSPTALVQGSNENRIVSGKKIFYGEPKGSKSIRKEND